MSHDNDGYWHVDLDEDPVWDFTEQRDLPVPYHKHPTKAEVCGHWHKQGALGLGLGLGIPCIEFVTAVETLHTTESLGLYVSRDNMVFQDGLIIGGAVNSGSIFKFDPNRNIFVNDTTFSVSDVSAIHQVEYYDGMIYALISRDGYVGKWIQKITIPTDDGDFELLDAPLYAGNVVIGSDDRIYGAIAGLNLNSFWLPYLTPITGSLWETGWEELPVDYEYKIYDSIGHLIVDGDEWGVGAICINFKIIDGEGLVINTGPASGAASITALIGYISFDGTRKKIFDGHTTIGPNELVVGPSGTDLALLRCTGGTDNLTLRMIDTDALIYASTDILITGLVDENGDPKDNSIYHDRTIWHHANNRIYSLHATWPDHYSRIIAVSPSGNLLYQYYIDVLISHQSFVILGDFVYLWQDGIHGSAYESAIIKLTLDLEFVCIEDCPGVMRTIGPREQGGSIISNGNDRIYNFAESFDGDGAITTYEVNPVLGEVAGTHGHDPRWEFDKQASKF